MRHLPCDALSYSDKPKFDFGKTLAPKLKTLGELWVRVDMSLSTQICSGLIRPCQALTKKSKEDDFTF
jgi:hypothetical protein